MNGTEWNIKRFFIFIIIMSLKTVQCSFACMALSSVVTLCECSAVYCHSDEFIVFGSVTNKNEEKEKNLVKNMHHILRNPIFVFMLVLYIFI